MNFKTVWLITVCLGLLAHLSLAQAPGGEFRLTKITKNLITVPEYAYTGAQQHRTNQADRWLEVEVEFSAAPEITDELTLKYFILLNGKLLAGEVTHAGVMAGKENRSVMYVSPKGIARCMGNQPVNLNSVQNITVQIAQKGAVKDELNLARAPAQWYSKIPPLTGLVLNKNETPFAPLYWDRYEQIKTAR